MPAIVAPYNAQGDSITAGYPISDSNNWYVNRIAAATGFTPVTNDAVGGNQINDVLSTIFNKTVNNKNQYTIFAGYNDMRRYNTDATHLTYFTDSLYSGVAWLGLPAINKFTGQSSKITYVGSWSTATDYGSIGKQSSTINDTATFTVYGTTAYICVQAVQGHTGQCNITVDGVNKGNFNCYSSDTSVNGIVDHSILIRVTGLTDQAHIVVLKVLATDVTALMWAGGNQGVNILNSPDVYVGNVIKMNAAGYLVGPPSNVGSDAAVALYNTQIQTVVTNLVSDGLSVYLVDICSVFDPNTAIMDVDNVHPNEAGHQIIANAFINKIYTRYRRIPVT